MRKIGTVRSFLKDNPSFYFGHKIKVKPLEELEKIVSSEKIFLGTSYLSLCLREVKELDMVGKEFRVLSPNRTSWLDDETFTLFSEDTNNFQRSIPVDFVETIPCQSKPLEAIALVENISTLENMVLEIKTSHNSDTEKTVLPLVKNEAVFPALDMFGRDCVLFKDCKRVDHRLTYEAVKKMVRGETIIVKVTENITRYIRITQK